MSGSIIYILGIFRKMYHGKLEFFSLINNVQLLDIGSCFPTEIPHKCT